ncbi:hypothetical protein OA067_01395 [Gammaproteobacteria bacterium]|nr:hypothetical protein [Gammaproteobacteria bacterium]
MKIPIIDLSLVKQDETQLELVDNACRDHGFFLLVNHGMKKEIEAMWEASSSFFAQTTEEKRQLCRTQRNPLGYFDKELTKKKRDRKEVFDYMQPRPGSADFNQWPKENKSFRLACENFFDAASNAATKTLEVVYMAYLAASDLNSELPGGDKRTSTVRFNFYPKADPLDEKERSEELPLGEFALNHHTDPGILTLLFQDMVGGLQALSKSNGWINIAPQKDAIVVNLGDSMQVWTNDNYRAAVHRVLMMDQSPRYSSPYFFNPARDMVLEPLSALSKAPPIYRPFTWQEYIRGRVDDNFSELEEDDIQISKYRVR